jgi:hypothetical protein
MSDLPRIVSSLPKAFERGFVEPSRLYICWRQLNCGFGIRQAFDAQQSHAMKLNFAHRFNDFL